MLLPRVTSAAEETTNLSPEVLATNEPIPQPIFFLADEDPAAVGAQAGDLERRFHAGYWVVGSPRRWRWNGWVRCAMLASRWR
jgi:hypothetical protein